MKILHIAPNAPYNDGWGYQENLLPKYHKRLGHDVTLIITNTMHKDGKIVETDCADYISKDGVRIIRLIKRKYFSKILTNLRSKMDVMPYLKEIQPDFVFFHGLISATIFDVIKYKKKINPNCVIVQDNHLDYKNAGNNLSLKIRLIRSYYRKINRKSIKYVERVYGVTPWRQQYAEEYFGIPAEKTSLLVMGGDDDFINLSQKAKIKESIRKELNLSENDFVVITGGKIDKTKNIHLLMQAIKELDKDNLKLIVFGQANEDMMTLIKELSEDIHIRYIGWIDSNKAYDYFLASDLAVFPGTHSVLWEQAVACGIPLIVKDWEGMHHVDVGGNCLFLQDDKVEEIKEKILEVYGNKSFYDNMLKVAEEKGIPTFSYSDIAKRAIEENIQK